MFWEEEYCYLHVVACKCEVERAIFFWLLWFGIISIQSWKRETFIDTICVLLVGIKRYVYTFFGRSTWKYWSIWIWGIARQTTKTTLMTCARHTHRRKELEEGKWNREGTAFSSAKTVEPALRYEELQVSGSKLCSSLSCTAPQIQRGLRSHFQSPDCPRLCLRAEAERKSNSSTSTTKKKRIKSRCCNQTRFLSVNENMNGFA